MYQRSGGTYCILLQLFHEDGSRRYHRNVAAFHQPTHCHISFVFGRLDGAAVNVSVMSTRLAFRMGGRLQAIFPRNAF